MSEGITFVLSDEVPNRSGRQLTMVQVGPVQMGATAEEVNRFLGTKITGLTRVDTYLLYHQAGVEGLERLAEGLPFVDPFIQRATVNEPLMLHLPSGQVSGADYVISTMLRPGTSDASGDIMLDQGLGFLGTPRQEEDRGFYAPQYFISGELDPEQIVQVSEFLANPDLCQINRFSFDQYVNGITLEAPIVTLPPQRRVERFDLSAMSDDELLELNKTRRLAATLEELQQLRDIFADQQYISVRQQHGLDHRITDVELETWFGLRSEHCFHKEFNAIITLDDLVGDPIFARAAERGLLRRTDDSKYILDDGIFKTFIQRPTQRVFDRLEERGNNWIASMFEDNASAVLYDEDFMFALKWETHNSPSNKEPVEGAKTGIDGVNRDIFGMGRGTFQAIANFFLYCTGDPKYKGWLPKGVKHPYYILKNITKGVRQGGNESQIGTLGGDVIIDPQYIAKCLVHCGTVGWSPVKDPDGKPWIEKIASIDDLVAVVGQAVGVDGIHGATESSLIADKFISLGHVQADYSYIQAKMKEFILEAARLGYFTAITDCGAMGIGSATHELARQTGGLDMDLARHPVKYHGIQPWQINCSETQDRMVVVFNPDHLDDLEALARKHDVPFTVLGNMSSSGYIHLRFEDETVGLLDIQRLFDKNPRKRMHATWTGIKKTILESYGEYSIEQSLCMVMSQPDVASKEWFFRQKDSQVGGMTVQGPLLGRRQEVQADCTIQKPLDTIGRDNGAIAYAIGSAPKLSDVDPYHAAIRSIIDMAGKVIAVGGDLPDMTTPRWDAWAICGNYCQPNSDGNTTLTRRSGEFNLASLLREGIAVHEVIDTLNLPVTSGKDSMKCSCVYDVPDDFTLEQLPVDLREHVTLVQDPKTGEHQIEIHDPDSYVSSCAVKIHDVNKTVDASFKQAGDLIYVVGVTRPELAASQFAQAAGYAERERPLHGGECPTVDLKTFEGTARAIYNAINDESVASCTYIHNGGFGAALARSAMAGELGAEVHIADIRQEGCSSVDEILYAETPGRFIVTITPEDQAAFEMRMESKNVVYSQVGTVTGGPYSSLSFIHENGRGELVRLPQVKQAFQIPLRFDLDALVEQ